GHVAPLIEVGAGLVPDLTGRENIYLNATILGMKKAEIRKKFDSIVAFAELAEFIDTPVKRYSSGMQVRLGFSIAPAVESDVLIVDVVLAVGGVALQRKCFDRIETLIRDSRRTVLVVSHNVRQIERLCDRAVLLNHGQLLAMGPPTTICDQYFALAATSLAESQSKSAGYAGRYESVLEFELEKIELLDLHGTETDSIVTGSEITVALHVQCDRPFTRLIFGLGIHTLDFVYLTTHSSESNGKLFDVPSGRSTLRCTISDLPLLPGIYQLRVGISDAAGATVFYGENLYQIRVVSPQARPTPASMRDGLFLLNAFWHADGRTVRVRECA